MERTNLLIVILIVLFSTAYGADVPPVDPRSVSNFTGLIDRRDGLPYTVPAGDYSVTAVIGTSNTAVLLSLNGSEVTMTGGSLYSNNVGSIGSATAAALGTITLDDVDIATGANGNWQDGLFVQENGIINYSNGTIKTEGDSSQAVHSLAGQINVKNATLETFGVRGSGVYVGQDGRVDLVDTTINTYNGDEGYGIYAINSRAEVTMTGGSITTRGTPTPSSPGRLTAVYGRVGAQITLNDVDITALGNNETYGLLSRENNTNVTMNGGTITTRGANSHGTLSVLGGTVTLNRADIRTTGAGSHGVNVWADSFAEIYGGKIAVDGSKASYAVLTEQNGRVTGNGVYDITGDIRNRTNGYIDLNFANGLRFKGGSDVGTGPGVVNFTMTDSLWIMDKDSTLTNFVLNGGRVNYRIEGAPYGTLETVNFSGDGGLFSMRVDIVGEGSGVNNKGDLLRVTGASLGTHYINVVDNGSARTDGTERLTIVETEDRVSSTFLLDHDVEIGAFLYGLRRVPEQDTDWELYSLGKGSNSGENSVNTIGSIYHVDYVEMQTLLQRMGELRQQLCAQGNLWARAYGGWFDRSAGQGVSGVDMKYYGLQIGVDKNIHTGANHEVYIGLLGGFTRSMADFNVGDGKTNSYYGGAYGVFKHDNGFYVDAVAKYSYMKSVFDTMTEGGDRVHGDGDAKAFSVSIEFGKRLHLGEQSTVNPRGWFIEPQIQATWGNYNVAAIDTTHGLRTKFRGFNSLLGRAGGLVGYSTEVADVGPLELYVKGNFIREFKGDAPYSFNSVYKDRYSFRGNRVEIGVGATMQIRDKHNLYTDFIYANGRKFDQVQFNIGYRLQF